ncbi:hypothetical protein FBUS_01921 [Fasciolopsis buskii]|uniref:Uncharacterized protein n=1 Tax=Fasciolopsis buskii TaxID=27845 RepID=A0A8E0S1U6_9TREM|nr:hypothetical protein FBUS_01921 [Fasciolopsis buski]
MTIGVIVEPRKLKNHTLIVSNFQMIDNAQVIVRRFRTNICLCMTPSGIVGTERLVNNTLTDNCSWRLRVSRHGVGFEHLVYADDIDLGTDGPGHEIPRYQVATLSAQAGKYPGIKSGWMYKLWEPEATWSVYQGEVSALREIVTTQSPNKTQFTTQVSTTANDNLVRTAESISAEQARACNNNNSNNNKSRNSSDDHSALKVGGKEVFWFQAPAQYIIDVQRNLQKKYCVSLIYNLSSTVQNELTASVKIINKLRFAYRQLEAVINQNRTDTTSSNDGYSVRRNASLSTLFDKWLFWTDLRWQTKIKRITERSNSSNQIFPPLCALSYSPVREAHIHSQDSTLSSMLEKYELTQVYYDLFMQVQHLARWTKVERRNWLRHPRLPTLLRYLGLTAPSAAQLRQAIFVLRRYLPKYDIISTNKSPSKINYGVAGTFDMDTLNRILLDRRERGAVVQRAIALKFEELRSWPRLTRRTNGKLLEQTPISVDSLRKVITSLGEKDYCYAHLVSSWFAYLSTDLPGHCRDQVIGAMSTIEKLPRNIFQTRRSFFTS